MTTNTKKITKKENFNTLIEILATVDHPEADALTAFLEQEIERLDKRAEKAKERAEKRKAAGDELRDEVLECLDPIEFKTVNMIMAEHDFGEVTKAKVVNRLSALVKLGFAEKETVKEDNQKRMAYRTVAAEYVHVPEAEETEAE